MQAMVFTQAQIDKPWYKAAQLVDVLTHTRTFSFTSKTNQVIRYDYQQQLRMP